MNLKLILIAAVVCLAAITPGVHAQTNTTVEKTQRVVRNQLVEEFSFLIKDFKVDHQGKSLLNIMVKYRYRPNIQLKEYPDFRWLAKDIENLLTHYPDETDYWEIVNKKIPALLLEKYPALATVTSQIDVSPSQDVPYFRTSTVTRTRASRK